MVFTAVIFSKNTPFLKITHHPGQDLKKKTRYFYTTGLL